ncbi:hypothetical protein [Limosilactobacillus reuteri]|uniref:hypothetical protein n=1 Tax=Limosilactobacillus reuteri TaxID=1598 RepID=UPI001E50D055|nr:hypothetical protein [Limosilactobacillus reuteri]MCC4466430.1 hypothetical protein [Limosilactobacillus reuteri]
MIYSLKDLFYKLEDLYGDINPDNFDNDLTAKVIMYFTDNPSDKARISRSMYRRMYDGSNHTFTSIDILMDVMVKSKLNSNIEWID